MAKTYAVGAFNAIARLDEHTGPWTDLVTLGDADTFWRDVMTDPLDEDKVIIVGSAVDTTNDNASIQVSTDAGVSWVIPSGDWVACDYFYELWYVTDLIIWAVGNSGQVVISLDGGASFNLTTARPFDGSLWQTAAIHAIDDMSAVVLGSAGENVVQQECYAFITTDAGATWTTLNGGLTLDYPGTGPSAIPGNANGIWMSPDSQKIVAASGYVQHISTDGGTTFTSVGAVTDRSGVHLTWHPSYDADPQYFRHTGGDVFQVNESTDNGLSYNQVRGYNGGVGNPIGNLPSTIRGAHFYTPTDGYYTAVDEIYSTSDGAVTGVLTHAGIEKYNVWEAVWTSVPQPPFTACYELEDCAGIAVSIFTETDMSAFVGQVVTLADETNHEIEGCWLVSLNGSCPDGEIVSVYKCYDTCEDCLPAEPAIKVPKPRAVKPGYETELCDPAIVDKAVCDYSDLIYRQMMGRRYMIQNCCPKDDAQIIMTYYKIQAMLLKTTNPTPDDCNPICYSYQIVIPVTDSAVTTYVDCLDVEQTIITPIGAADDLLPRTIGFCALDTSVPTSIVTHPDTTTDTYILDRVSECEPPYVDPRACIGYSVTMNNPSLGNQVFRYLDCDGVEVVITLAGGTKPTVQYNFCGYEGQTIVREETFDPGSIFNVTEGPCTGLPPCAEFEITFNDQNNGSFNYLDCNGVAQVHTYTGNDTDNTVILCGSEGQTITCDACNYFVVVQTGYC
jgi:photosystem II stability/assembly factor-like uncharacterized protein